MHPPPSRAPATAWSRGRTARSRDRSRAARRFEAARRRRSSGQSRRLQDGGMRLRLSRPTNTVGGSEMADTTFTRMQDATREDYKIIGRHSLEFFTGLPERILRHLEILD